MTTLSDIERCTKSYAEARHSLAAAVGELKERMDGLKSQAMPRIKRSLAKAAECQAELSALIQDAPELFTKPRTVIFHGVKLGYQKGKGGIAFDDASQVIKLIRKHLPDQADLLIQTTEKPAKDAIANLAVTDLKRIGCNVVDAGDVIVIKPTDAEVDKMVDALLKDAVNEEVPA